MDAHESNIAAPQSDRLLWLAAGVVGALALTWLLISQFWSGAELPEPAAFAPAAASNPSTTASPAAPSRPDSGFDNPLRMAQLAYESGMLIEPEGYSAWSLFADVLAQDPDNATAHEGLSTVAEDLLQRTAVALEQGRSADARAVVDRILLVLPEHQDALELQAAIAADAEEPEPEPERRAARPPAPEPPAAPEPARAPRPAIERAAVAAPIDPIVERHEAFKLAMRENRLLTPASDNAKRHLEALLDANPSHELTLAAQALLADELLARSRQALEALDPDAARTWIDAAEPIAPDAVVVAQARAVLDARLIELEAAKVLPATELKITDYVAPQYPQRAASRSIEGWVDIEFTVGRDGTTRDVVVADGSHQRFFRDEAIEAVSQWRFEPRIFMNQAIEQRSYTRIRFSLAE